MPQALSRFAGWGLALALLIPVVLYWALPTVGVTALAHKFSLPWLLSTVNMLVFGTLFGYLAYLSCTRYLIIPVVALYLYQLVDAITPLLHLPNYMRTMYILLAFFLAVFGFQKFRFVKGLSPLIPIFLFVGLNIIYVSLGYMEAPNFMYMPEFYVDKPPRFIPTSHGVNLAVFLLLMTAAIYITFNAFSKNIGNIRKGFKYFIVYFLLGYSLFSIAAYFLNDVRFMNILAGVKRLAGLNGHTNIFAFFLNISMMYIFSFLYQPHNPEKYPSRLWTIVSVVVGAIAVLLSFSRANIFGLFFITVINNVLLAKNRTKSIAMTAGLIFGIIVLVGLTQASGLFDIMGIITNRLDDDASSNFRPITWAYVLSQMQFDWTLFFGHGIGAVGAMLNNLYSTRYFFSGVPYVYHPHNSYLHILYDYGILGLAFYMSFPLWCVLSSFKKLRQNLNNISVKHLLMLELSLFILLSSITDAFMFDERHIISFWILIVALYAECNSKIELPLAPPPSLAGNITNVLG